MRVFRLVFKVLLVVFVGLGVAIIVLRILNPSPASSIGWHQKAAMPSARGEVASAMVGKRLIVVGGLTGATSTSRAVSVYDARFDAWLNAPALPEGRHHAAAASSDGAVYVAGGAASATEWTPKTDAWRAEPGDKWDAVASMPEGRQGHAMVSIGEKLFVVGGVGKTDDMLIYDIGDDAWERGAPLPEGRDHLRAVAWDGRVWALGGRSGALSDRVDVYEPRTDTWKRGVDLPIPMSAMAVGVISDELHVIGGEDPRPVRGGVLDQHFQLGANDDEWKVRSRQMLPVHGAGFGVFERSLIIAGGASRQGAYSVLSWSNVTQTLTTRSMREFSPD